MAEPSLTELSLATPPNPSQEASRHRLALAILVLGAVCIAFAPIFVRLADVGPVSVVAWRLGLSIPFALVWTLQSPNGAHHEKSRWGPLWLILAGVLLAVDLALWHIAIHYTSVANSTFILNLAPIFVTLGASWFFGEKFGRGFVFALIAAIVGAALLVRASFGGSHQALTGDLIALTAAVFYAGYQLTVKHCRRFYATSRILAATAIVSPLVLIVPMLVLGETILPSTTQGWLAVIGIALVCQVLGQGLITWAVGYVRANLASVVLLVQPVIAAWLAALLFGEWLQSGQIVGCLLVLAGIAFARRASR